MSNKKQSSIDWLEQEFVKLEATVGVHSVMYELIEQAKAMENNWKLVKEETPPSDVELLVQSHDGINHLANWRNAYGVFTCQDKREIVEGWKWKLI